ncbi:MAG TPA: M28 family peptidase [Ferruginibacter sp.]|nr:M28 family peptidase [Ferruginibacter sp.]HRE62135.1 M28 family peptidase [Ferruginibacter sp.]
MNKWLATATLLLVNSFIFAQNIDKIITAPEVERIEKVLAADEMRGRKTGSPEIDMAADFIGKEFKKAGLQYFAGLNDYRQSFKMTKAKFVSAAGIINEQPIASGDIIAVTTQPVLKINETAGYKKIVIDSSSNLIEAAAKILEANSPSLVLVNTAHTKNFNRLKRFKRDSFDEKASVVFVLSNADAQLYSFEIEHQISSTQLANVIGVLPGKSKKDELVIFSGHYDHIGVGKPNAAGDSIYNGANDDAAGTTAVIMLANYFAKLNNNERTLVFVTFTAEEVGGFGSQYFSKQIDADKAIAMFNIEMIGTESQWGKNSAYITGFEKSDFGTILQRNLAGSAFKFEPDPYPKQNLFYRSDNATLAALGVPAHTISTSKMDTEKFYHTVDDEIETLDMVNMAEIIKAIALSSKGIISGKETPARVEKLK